MRVKIGCRTQLINPFNLVTVKFIAGTDQTVLGTEDPTANQYLDLITGCYQLKETKIDMYQDQIKNGLREMICTLWTKDRIDAGKICFAGAYGDE